jgi:hypothetical protein
VFSLVGRGRGGGVFRACLNATYCTRDSTFSDFLDLGSSLYGLGVSCIHPVYFGLHLSTLF